MSSILQIVMVIAHLPGKISIWIFTLRFNCIQINCVKNSYLMLELFTEENINIIYLNLFNCLQIIDVW